MYGEDGENTELGIFRFDAGKFQIIAVGDHEELSFQNHDVIGKTVYEISRIFEILDGANDIDIDKEFGRIEEGFEWDLKTLRLFRDGIASLCEISHENDIQNRCIHLVS